MIFATADPAPWAQNNVGMVSMKEVSCRPTWKLLVRSSAPKLELKRRWAASFYSWRPAARATPAIRELMEGAARTEAPPTGALLP